MYQEDYDMKGFFMEDVWINCKCGNWFSVDLDFIEWNCPHCGRIYKLTVDNEPEERE